MKYYGENLSNQRIAHKLLISLPRSYNSIASVIENTKDLEIVDAQDVAILKGYEQRIERHYENRTKKTFASLSVTPKQNKFNANRNFNSKKNQKINRKKWENKHVYQQGKSVVNSETTKNPCKQCDKLHFGKCWLKEKPKCHNFDKFCYIAKDYHDKKAIQHVNYASHVDETHTMFFACNVAIVKKCEDVCGCNNYMID